MEALIFISIELWIWISKKSNFVKQKDFNDRAAALAALSELRKKEISYAWLNSGFFNVLLCSSFIVQKLVKKTGIS